VTGRQLVGLGIVVASVGLVATHFLMSAGDTAATARVNACKAMAPDPVPPALAHKEAPDFELPDVHGKRWSLKSLRGRPVLLNFWATWCAPCAEEMPSIEDLARAVGDRAVVVAVSVDEGWEPIKKFFPKGTPLSVLLDENKDVPKKFGTDKYPETFLIDAQGKVKHYFINVRKWGQPEAAECLKSLI
jgi:cytochrome c biogenesis protein CcmG/thiol:disulfide interchange protein DsbE